MKNTILVSIAFLGGAAAMTAQKPADKNKKEQPKQLSALDKYIKEASQAPTVNQIPANGSLWSPAARFSDLASDLRARHVDDIVTILVAESAAATSTGSNKASRTTNAKANIPALGGVTNATLTNLANLGSASTLDGEGTTSRQTTLTTTVTARVTHVLSNGNLVVEGSKNVAINSENQIITIRGVIRPIDLDTTNSIQSARLAQMEVQVDRKSVV